RMNEQVLQNSIIELIKKYGDLGVFLGMFFESSIVPIPSEVVIIGAGTIGISVASILIFGSLGATLGASVGYALGRYAATPVILKFGRFIFIKPHHIYKAEAFARKYGAWSVLIGRLLPIVPFKVFSIAAGITKIPFIPFMAFTMIGVLPRIYLLTIFGYALVKYTKPVLIITFFAILVFLAFKLVSMMQKKTTAAERREEKCQV
ncbi:MAG: DedA family protein, partial [Candidatus Omnitrophota bacterium]|nr:DedA family protein [Candidatus Omnitrophota bacterium]